MAEGGWDIEISAFDHARHDRKEFDSGVVRIDNFIKLSAKKQQKGDFTRCFVATRINEMRVIGFYTLSAHALEVREAPADVARHAPHDVIPALYLSMLGVSREAQGQGIGSRLMADAFRRAVETSQNVGIAVLMLDVLQGESDTENRRRKRFYESLGFQALEAVPHRMVIAVSKLRQAVSP